MGTSRPWRHVRLPALRPVFSKFSFATPLKDGRAMQSNHLTLPPLSPPLIAAHLQKAEIEHLDELCVYRKGFPGRGGLDHLYILRYPGSTRHFANQRSPALSACPSVVY